MIQFSQIMITDSERPYVLAALPVNHNGSIIKAKESIKVSKEFGADAIKFKQIPFTR